MNDSNVRKQMYSYLSLQEKVAIKGLQDPVLYESIIKDLSTIYLISSQQNRYEEFKCFTNLNEVEKYDSNTPYLQIIIEIDLVNGIEKKFDNSETVSLCFTTNKNTSIRVKANRNNTLREVLKKHKIPVDKTICKRCSAYTPSETVDLDRTIAEVGITYIDGLRLEFD